MSYLSARSGPIWKIVAAIVICAAVCFALPAVRAESVEPLTVDFSVSPAEMVAPGNVTMTFIIRNTSDSDVQNIYLSSADGLVSEPVGRIDSGDEQTLVRPHLLTQDELDDGAVRYIISYDATEPGGEKSSRMLSAYVLKGSARPDIDFTRQLSSRDVTPGSQLTITYRLTNNGNVPVTDIELQDAPGDFSATLELLDVGATKTFVNRIAVTEPIDSAATLRYTVPSGGSVERALTPTAIDILESEPEATFSVGRSAFDPDRADAVLMLFNNGTDEYENIIVTDDVYGGVIAEGLSLPGHGASSEISHTYPLRGSGSYRWRVTGMSRAGDALDFVTETLTLEPSDEAREIGVQLTAMPRLQKIDRPGRVTFDLSIRNTGNAMAEGLRVYEVERGVVRDLAVLPTGDPTCCSVGYEVEETTNFIFCVNYTDAEGRARTVSTDPIEIEITPSGASPESARTGGAPKGPSVKMGKTKTFMILLIVASAALISMITILIVTSVSASREKRRRIAAQRARRQKSSKGRKPPRKRAPKREKSNGAQ